MATFPTLAGRHPGMTRAETLAVRRRITRARAEIYRQQEARALNGRQQDTVLALELFEAAPSYFAGDLNGEDRALLEDISEQLGIPLVHLAPDA